MSVQVSYKKQTVFFVILIITTFLLAEGIVRTFDPTTSCQFVENELFDKYDIFEKQNICFEYTTIGVDFSSSIRLLEPNQSGKYLNINSDGFRGKEFNFQPDDYKIFVLGGSTTFGFISSTDDFSIPAILEKKLQNENLNVKVINAGIPGAHSRSELYYLENYILKYSPDMIIMYDGINESENKHFTYEEFNENNYFVNHNRESIGGSKTGILTFFAKIDCKSCMGVVQIIKSFTKTTEFSPPKYQEAEEEKDPYLIRAERLENSWSRVCSLGFDNEFKTVHILQPAIGVNDRILSDSEKLVDFKDSTQFLKTLNLNKTKLQHCDEIWDLRNTFDHKYDGVTLFFDPVHLNDIGNEIIADAIHKKLLPVVMDDIQK